MRSTFFGPLKFTIIPGGGGPIGAVFFFITSKACKEDAGALEVGGGARRDMIFKAIASKIKRKKARNKSKIKTQVELNRNYQKITISHCD